MADTENNLNLASNAIALLVRRNSAKIDTVWGSTARTEIPDVPVVGLPYRRADLPDTDIQQGQGYEYIYDGARYNQILWVLTSLWKSMCENGGMPFQKGQTYQQGGLMTYDNKLWCALRAINGSENPYPMPYESPYWYDLSPKSFGANTTTSDGYLGLVPKPSAGETAYMLGSNAKWSKYASPFAVGSIIAYAGKTSPNGWLYCDGSVLKRADYPTLFSVIGTKYGVGDGTSTFQIPDLRNRVLQGSSTMSSGSYLSAGVPSLIHTHSASLNTLGSHTHTLSVSNTTHSHSRGTWEITGYFGGTIDDSSAPTGAFYHSGSRLPDDGGRNTGYSVSFQASRNWTGQTNSTGAHNHTWSFGSAPGHTHGVSIDKNVEIHPEIYGQANTVQMASCTCNYIIKI